MKVNSFVGNSPIQVNNFKKRIGERNVLDACWQRIKLQSLLFFLYLLMASSSCFITGVCLSFFRASSFRYAEGKPYSWQAYWNFTKYTNGLLPVLCC